MHEVAIVFGLFLLGFTAVFGIRAAGVLLMAVVVTFGWLIMSKVLA